MSQDDFTKPPVPQGPRERLAPTMARARIRDVAHERRDVPPIEAVRISRVDVHWRGSAINDPPRMEISLPRVKFLERPER